MTVLSSFPLLELELIPAIAEALAGDFGAEIERAVAAGYDIRLAWTAAFVSAHGYVEADESRVSFSVCDIDNVNRVAVVRSGREWSCDCGDPSCLHILAASLYLADLLEYEARGG